MSAGFLDPRVVSDGLSLDVRFRIENRSGRAWNAEQGFCLGWQLFDPDTSLFISEGEWFSLPNPVQPSASAEVALRIEMPPEPGPYHVYISPRTEAEGWHYQQEWPFLLLETTVQRRIAGIESVSVTTRGSLRRRRWWRNLAAAFTDPVLSLWRNRRLIASMTRRDIAGRYRGSVGDILWTLFHPLLLMLTYFFVFGVVLQARFGQDPSRSGFVLYFLAGMLPWLPISDAVARAPGIILENRNFVKKLLFPVEILPVNPVLAGLVGEAFALLIFVCLLLAARGAVPLTALWLPVLVAPQLLLTLAVCWTLAALGVYLRDLGQIIGFALTVVFFLTPICYPQASLPASAVAILSMSPFYVLVEGYRAVLLEARPPDWMPLLALYAASALACLFAHAWFTRLKRSFPDVI
jgi:lipopolysaccharide transport system permease protein